MELPNTTATTKKYTIALILHEKDVIKLHEPGNDFVRKLESDETIDLHIIHDNGKEIDLPMEVKTNVEIAIIPAFASSIKLVLDHFPNLKWVHTTFTGCDKVLSYEPFGKSNIPFTNTRGASSIPLAEFTIGACLYFYKKLDAFYLSKEKKIWEPQKPLTLSGKTLLVVGYGAIGNALGKMCKAGFNMDVHGIKRKLDGTEKAQYPEVKVFYTMDNLTLACAEADIIYNTLPWTQETNQIFNEEVFKSMKKEAIFVNVGRGETVNEPDLCKALKKGWIANAVLDVFAVEPLNPQSAFYTDDDIRSKILISCHSGDKVKEIRYNRVLKFLENFESYKQDGTLKSVVDKVAGY